MKVPNEFPTDYHLPYRLAIIGEAPDMDEAACGKPFTSSSGRFLSALLSAVNISRQACFLGNICQVRPPNNDIKTFSPNGPEITSGIAQLKSDLATYQPNMCVLLGSLPLQIACNRSDISNYRGSIFKGCVIDSPFFGTKCMSTYHPSYALRDYSVVPIIKFDLNRARVEGMSKDLNLPVRSIATNLSFIDIIERLQDIKARKCTIAFDIEGWGKTEGSGMSCCSIATAANDVFHIPFNFGPKEFWTPNQEITIWLELASVLEDPTIPKILQNCMYDQFVLAWKHHILIRGIVDDTMLLHWEKYCEMEKNLALQTSIYTREPYYKDTGKSVDQDKFFTYSCLDSAVTYEIRDTLKKYVTGSAYDHYLFNISLLKPMMYMELKGTRLDEARRQEHIRKTTALCAEWQNKLNEAAGWAVNVKSYKDVPKLLFDQLKLPKMYKRGTTNVTTDYENILLLFLKTENPVLNLLIQTRFARTRLQDLEKLTPDADGRIRCAFNLVGTVTGRLSSSESPTGNGTNLANVTKDVRDCFIADEGHEYFQCDLSGADGWTVAAHSARLGDMTMLEDYLAGIKPAKVICLMRRHGTEITKLSRAELKLRCKEVSGESNDYFCCKCIQHGSNYGMSEKVVQMTILKKSKGSIYIKLVEAAHLQKLYFYRYPGIIKWHRWMEEQLKTKGYLISANGHKRQFFGRKNDKQTWKAALAEEPQNNTCYATNKALLNLWLDKDNRAGNKLIIQPSNQIHDALTGQYPIELREFASKKMHEYFNNVLIIAGVKITIPYEGGRGHDWGNCKEEL